MDRLADVWRLVGGQAIRCTECTCNKVSALKENDIPVGVEYECIAENEVCVFLGKKIDSQKVYGSFKEAYDDVDTGEEGAE